MSPRSGNSNSVTPYRVIVGVLILLVIVFALLNSQSVTMHWILTTTQTPLFVILILFALIGLIVGFFLGRRSGRR